MSDTALRRTLAALEGRPASRIDTHAAECCRMARAWMQARLSLEDGLEWLRTRYPWGPHRWPLHWCDVACADRLDCGGLAALAHHVLQARGAQAYPVQLVERFDESTGRAWARRWAKGGGTIEWVWGDLVYHEGVTVLSGGELTIWDPTDGCSVDDRARTGYGALVALRVVDLERSLRGVKWLGAPLSTNTWTVLPAELSVSALFEGPRSRKIEGRAAS